MQETNFISNNSNINLGMMGPTQNYNGMFCYNTQSKQANSVRTNKETPCHNNTHQKKSRTVFTKKQILRLEGVFYEKRYLTIKDREELSKSLSLSESQVKVWFQNRRNKWKREMAFKVEYAKFNMLPNHNLTGGADVGRGVDDTYQNNMLPPPPQLSSTQSSDMTSLTQLDSKYDLYNRVYYTEPYLQNPPQTYQSMFNHGSPNSYSPGSNTSSNNESGYQEINPTQPSSVTCDENGNNKTGNIYRSQYEDNTLRSNCEFGIAPFYNDLNCYNYQTERDSNNTYDLNTTSSMINLPKLSSAPSMNESTEVVYTTLNDCRYGDTQILNFPNQCSY